MLQYQIKKQKFAFILLMLIFTGIAGYAQKANTKDLGKTKPVWWFGESGAANFNSYRGTTQNINQNLTVPIPFHKGDGVKPYASLLAEYRPNNVWGGMLNIAYDGRGGNFTEVMACDCPQNLSTKLSYLAIEPSLRFAPFASAFYVFAGPTININLSKSFTYTHTQLNQSDIRVDGDWSDINKVAFSGQAGAGIDIAISKKTSATQMTLSPFASFQTDFGTAPRKVESWSLYTVRAGIALKFGTNRKSTPEIKQTVAETIKVNPVVEQEVQFSVRAPKVIPLNRQVKETFPLRNSVFFNLGSSDIPKRYVLLSKAQAASFKEEQLQQAQPERLDNGRSSRQLAVYYNILNIIGDRMRANPQSSVTLTGASDKDPVDGKLMAENVKQYLVNVFGISASKILTEGRDKPVIPSEQPGATNDLTLLREGDRRVDIASTSDALLMQIGGNNSPFFKPVQITAIQADPLDSHVIFNVDKAEELLKSWSVQVTDEEGKVQNFGPFTKDQASVSGKTILGTNTQGNYKVTMTGETKSGTYVNKESSVSLMKMNDSKQEGLRYSILFDFDQSKTIASYEKFLTDVVTPLIPENSTVSIHGHTDIIGEEAYNHNLSYERARSAQQILQKALSAEGKKGVKFQVYGFGEDRGMAPFENNLPEQRFYNRTVIIDIIPAN